MKCDNGEFLLSWKQQESTHSLTHSLTHPLTHSHIHVSIKDEHEWAGRDCAVHAVAGELLGELHAHADLGAHHPLPGLRLV